jgi:hypothetical protein
VGKTQMVRLNTVAQACNPSYLGGINQEAHSSKPAQSKKFMRLMLTNGGVHLSTQL